MTLLPFKLKQHLKGVAAIGAVFAVVACLTPEAAQAKARYSGTANFRYNFDIDNLVQDFDGNLTNERGAFPSALQNITLQNGSVSLLTLESADLVSSSFNRLPDRIGKIFETPAPVGPTNSDYKISGEEFIQDFGSGAKYEAIFNQVPLLGGGFFLTRISIYVGSADPNRLDSLLNLSANTDRFPVGSVERNLSLSNTIVDIEVKNASGTTDFRAAPPTIVSENPTKVPENPVGALLGTGTIGALLLLRRAKCSSRRI